LRRPGAAIQHVDLHADQPTPRGSSEIGARIQGQPGIAMTDKEEILVNKMIAAGGWIRRAQDKRKVLSLFQAEHALREAVRIIDGAIELLRGPQDGRPNEKF